MQWPLNELINIMIKFLRVWQWYVSQIIRMNSIISAQPNEIKKALFVNYETADKW